MMFQVKAEEADYLLASYDFDLPEDCVAQEPCPDRGGSRLYLLDRTRPAEDRLDYFTRIARLLPPGSLLVANNAKVIPARIISRRSSGGLLELLLLHPPPILEAGAAEAGQGWREAEAEALIRPAGKIPMGRRYELGEGLAVTVLEKGAFGQTRILLAWEGRLASKLERYGQIPLPPYIRRNPKTEDLDRYQTIYADEHKAGAVAAPTAGLHFTRDIKDSLIRAGHGWAELTLFVGYGTFSPVRTQDIRQHRLHPEYVELPEATVQNVLQAKKEGRPVVAVGTTSARALEGVAEALAQKGDPRPLCSHQGWLNCFIYPGRPLRVADALITNFHLPESTLIMLAAAFTGRSRLLEAYGKALAQGCRFFSYGDAMLIR